MHLVVPTHSLTNSRELNRLVAFLVAPTLLVVVSSATPSRISSLVSSSQQQADVSAILLNIVYPLMICRSVRWQPAWATCEWWLVREHQ